MVFGVVCVLGVKFVEKKKKNEVFVGSGRFEWNIWNLWSCLMLDKYGFCVFGVVVGKWYVVEGLYDEIIDLECVKNV